MLVATVLRLESAAAIAFGLALGLSACSDPGRGQTSSPSTEIAEVAAQPPPTTPGQPFSLRAELPAGPAQAPIYRQLPIDTSFDADRASKVAAQLGVTGEVSSYIGEGGETVYEVSGGGSQIFVSSDSPLVFSYSANGEPIAGPPSTLFPFEERARSATEFLQAHHLLDFQFLVEPATGSNFDSFSVRIATLLPGGRLYENDGRTPRIWVVIDETASVWHVFYQTLNLRSLGEYPLRPAATIWEDLTGNTPLYGASYRIIDQTTGETLSTRGRSPLPGESEVPVEISLDRVTVEQVELVYFASDFRGHSVNAFPADSPVRLVQPMWRFAGHLDDGNEFELLARAVEVGALEAALEVP